MNNLRSQSKLNGDGEIKRRGYATVKSKGEDLQPISHGGFFMTEI